MSQNQTLIPKYDPTRPVIVDGIEYQPDEIYQRNIMVYGVQPTDYEDYQYVHILALHPNRKAGAGGQAQSLYRYDNLNDLNKFHEHKYPYLLPCDMVTASDKKGNQIQVILFAHFEQIKEMILVPLVQYKQNLLQQNNNAQSGNVQLKQPQSKAVE